MKTKHIQHLYWRAGFGIEPKELEKIKGKSRKEIVDKLFYDSRRTATLHIDQSELKDINPKTLKADKKAQKKLADVLKKKLVELNTAWVERLANPKGLLREKMTLFWANHFVCRENNSFFAEKYNNTLRQHALGNFRSFTKAVSKEAAMIKYLNLKQNRRQNPNENFARELMELFTLGNGNYSEADIKESAKAFTGYNHDFYGNFVLRKRQHDYNDKTYFGRTGNFSGDDIIDIILVEKQCARFICHKIYRYFVNETNNEAHIDDMVAKFYPSYDIERVMRHVFMSDWFYDQEHIGSKIKSPIEFLVGMHQVVPMRFKDPKQLVGLQKILGQILLLPPNVAGWQGGKQWIDANTILLRLRLPSVLLNNALISFKEEGEFNDTFLNRMRRNAKAQNVFKVESDWNMFENKYAHLSYDELTPMILQNHMNRGSKNWLEQLKRTTKRDYCIQLMSLPEYQLC